MDSKAKAAHRFYSSLDGVTFDRPRYFGTPTDCFFELMLTPKQTKKMKQWEKNGDEVIYLWTTSYDRVVFQNETKLRKFHGCHGQDESLSGSPRLNTKDKNSKVLTFSRAAHM
jgi:hypothetical protein